MEMVGEVGTVMVFSYNSFVPTLVKKVGTEVEKWEQGGNRVGTYFSFKIIKVGIKWEQAI